MQGSRVSHHPTGTKRPAATARPAARPLAKQKGGRKEASSIPSLSARRVATGPARPFSLLLIMALLAGLVTARLAFWSTLEHGQLAATALKLQREARTVQPPMRGRIFDAEHDPLATDVNVTGVAAMTKQIKNPLRTAQLLSPLIQIPVQTLVRDFTGGRSYVVLRSSVSPAVDQRILDLGLAGIVPNPEVQRTYPDGSLASQALGYTNVDGNGINGVEQYYNSILAGHASISAILQAAGGDTARVAPQASGPARSGGDLTLTIDPTIQAYTDLDIRNAVKTHRADGGTIIVLNPHTGRILGMSSTPSYNPNNYNWYANRGLQSRFLNPAIQFSYEPGSTFKILTMAAGLDSGVITPQSALYDPGYFRIAGQTLHNWNDQGNGIENMTQVLQHSANVGASWVAGRLGTKRFYHYVNKFGIGQPTGVGLAGEDSGQLWQPNTKQWTIVNLFTNSFGQGLTVTPLQLISAVGAVANGGLLMKPEILKQTSYDGQLVTTKPVVERRVISATTAHTLTNMLVHSAVGGEAQEALVHGYNIAAKTGTANVAGPNGGYLQNVTNASVVGWAPAFHPRFCVIVLLQHPRDFIWGSMTAAPVMSTLFKQLFMYFHIPPSSHPLYP